MRLPAAERLQEQLGEVEGKRPTMRLMVAIAHEQGVSQTDLAEWYGLSRKTVYNWLRRLEEASIEEAIRDDRRPGRPPKLTEAQRDEVAVALEQPPASVGYEADAWTPALLKRYIADAMGVDYSVRTCRRLMGD